jgi:hypothetical protein
MFTTGASFGGSRIDTWNPDGEEAEDVHSGGGASKPLLIAAPSSSERFRHPLLSSHSSGTALGWSGWYSAARATRLDWGCQAPLWQLYVSLADTRSPAVRSASSAGGGTTVMVEVEATDTLGLVKERLFEAQAALPAPPGRSGPVSMRGLGAAEMRLARPWPRNSLHFHHEGQLLGADYVKVGEAGIRRGQTLLQVRAALEPEPEPEPEPLALEAKSEMEMSRDMFLDLDRERAGEITTDALREGLRSRGLSVSDQDFQAAFGEVDVDGGGTISMAEWQASGMASAITGLMSFGGAEGEGGGALSWEQAARMLKDAGVAERNIQRALRAMDRDGDSSFTLAEIAGYLKRRRAALAARAQVQEKEKPVPRTNLWHGRPLPMGHRRWTEESATHHRSLPSTAWGSKRSKQFPAHSGSQPRSISRVQGPSQMQLDRVQAGTALHLFGRPASSMALVRAGRCVPRDSTRSISTDIYRCHACSCHEIDGGKKRPGRCVLLAWGPGNAAPQRTGAMGSSSVTRCWEGALWR